MALPVIERPGSSNPCNLRPLVGESYELKLKQSIRSLLAEIRKQDHEPEFEPSRFIQEEKELYELMQARVDPPLDSIWVYTALIFRSREYPKNEPLDLLDSIAAAKRLFHLASAFSASCGSSKSIALLAPVVYEVYKVVLQLSGKDLTLKREKKVMKEVKSLTEAILAHINVCCGTGKGLSDVAEAGLKSITPFVDLVGVWMDSNVGLESFLPLVTAEVRERLSEGECEVGYLAGVVITEAFLLKLCLNFKLGVSGTREDLEKEKRSWAVGSITDFCNFYFFETLLRMLLEKNLPLAFILSSEDGDLLRKVLYDAIILVDYSFLELEAAIHLPADHMRSLYVTRLIVTHEAIEYVREHGDQRRSISYSNAFSNSHLQTQIIKWFKNQILTEENASKFNGSSPKALIKWLLNLEDQGVRVFEDSSLKYHSKLVRDTSKPDFEQPACKLDSKRVEDDLLFYVDNKGEKEDTDEEDEDTNESMNAAFIAASHTMKSMDKGGRKRKEGTSAEKKKKTKYIKYELLNNYESSSGSEVENPPSDEDSESKDE